tara:strand:+ start:2753 stop:2914 length:162 start_codon:yes stop_codon:yes gene_type:complete
MRLFKKIFNFFWDSNPHSGLNKREEEWLAQSTDLCELERRMKQLENSNLKGWI